MASRSWRAAVVTVIAVIAACDGDTLWGDSVLYIPPPPPQPLEQVSGLSTFADNCDGQNTPGTLYVSSEVEPSLAINPTDGTNWVGVWQQNRWSNGGADGLVAGVTVDGGQTWTLRTTTFSRCTGGNVVNGGDYARATDPWISFGPTGIAYWMAMTITDTAATSRSAMRVSRSIDGGDTWNAPITLIDDVDPYFNDKNAITADPTDAAHIYAAWDRLDALLNGGPAWFARSTDGGDTWEAAREIYDPGSGAQTVGNLIAVLPDGTLLNLFTEIHFDSAQPDGAFLKVLRSTDKGVNWAPPITVAEMLTVGTENPATGAPVRTGGILGSIAVGPGPLDVWVAWQDSRHSAFFSALDGIVLSRSADGGDTWDAPVLISLPDTQAFTPTVHVAADGTIGVTYYDFRDDVVGDPYLLTSYWLAASTDGGSTWTERLISGPFDLAIAPDALGLFLGDYEGLGSAGTDFVPFFAQTQPSLTNRTNIYSVALPTVAPFAKVGRSEFRSLATMAPVVVTPEWREQIQRNIELNRKHFPDRWRPGQVPKYLLRLG